MGQRKVFRLYFCPGGILIPLSQTTLDLRESLVATHMALEAADSEVAGIRACLVEANRRVAG